MHGPFGAHARVIFAELLTEIDPLLPIRSARSQFPIQWKPTSPGGPTVRHADLRLFRFGQRKKGERFRSQSVDSIRSHSVPGNIKETVAPRCGSNGFGNRQSLSRERLE